MIVRPEQQGTLLISTKLKLTLASLAGAAAIAGALLLGAGIGNASDTPVHRGDTCTQLGQERKDRSGDVYVCTQKPGDTCPRFHAKHPGHGGQPLPPCVCPSPSTSAGPPKSPSASPSKSPSASTSPSITASPSKPASPKPSGSATVATSPAQPAPSTTPVAASLPVTGESNTLLLLSWAAVLIGSGALLLFGTVHYRRRTA